MKNQLGSTKCKLMQTIIEQKIEDIEHYIAMKVSDKNAKKISEQFNDMTLGEGSFSQVGFWRVKNKLCPKNGDPPMAKRDCHGNLVTSPENLKALYLETYQNRLRKRKIRTNFEDLMILKNELWKYRLSNLKSKVSNPWTLSNLENALKSLKNNQARDPMGLINELFKPGMLGDQMKFSTLSLMNAVKNKV